MDATKRAKLAAAFIAAATMAQEKIDKCMPTRKDFELKAFNNPKKSKGEKKRESRERRLRGWK